MTVETTLPHSRRFAITRLQKVALGIVLSLLALVTVYCLYWMAFSGWMLDFSYTDHRKWTAHFYMWMAAASVSGITWITIVAWFIRRRKKKALPNEQNSGKRSSQLSKMSMF